MSHTIFRKPKPEPVDSVYYTFDPRPPVPVYNSCKKEWALMTHSPWYDPIRGQDLFAATMRQCFKEGGSKMKEAPTTKPDPQVTQECQRRWKVNGSEAGESHKTFMKNCSIWAEYDRAWVEWHRENKH